VIYEYRVLLVDVYDKHEDEGKQRRGSSPDRTRKIVDSGEESPIVFADQVGDDYWTFLRRARRSFVHISTA
jgi:hypothetical protein